MPHRPQRAHEHLDDRRDRRERVSHFMGNAGSQRPNALHLLGVDELLLERLLFGDITVGTEVPHNGAVCADDGRDQQVGEDRLSVFPAVLDFTGPDSSRTE